MPVGTQRCSSGSTDNRASRLLRLPPRSERDAGPRSLDHRSPQNRVTLVHRCSFFACMGTPHNKGLSEANTERRATSRGWDVGPCTALLTAAWEQTYLTGSEH